MLSDLNITEKVTDDKNNLGLNLKRAPSAGTVTSTNDNNMWERSQSDVNLSIHQNKTNSPNVSENPRVYWNLSDPEHGDAPWISVMNSSVFGGFQMGLETIDQHDEMYEMTSSNNSVTSGSYYESGTFPTKSEKFQKKQVHSRYLSCTMENLINPDKNSELVDADTRKSCSALPTTFRRPISEADNLNDPHDGTTIAAAIENTEGLLQKHRNDKKPQILLENTTSNYFCESDFDVSREEIPNYQSQLKCLQEDMIKLISLLEINLTPVFQWPSNDSIERKTELLSKCREMINNAWQMPNVGRDCATFLCDLMRQYGLVNYLTHCMSKAGQVVTVADPNIPAKIQPFENNRYLFVLTAAKVFSQILTCDNIDSILGLSSGNSTPKKDDSHGPFECDALSKPVKLFKEVVKQSWLIRTDKDLNREFISILEALLKHHENTNRIVVQNYGLKSLIYSCRSTDNVTLRHVALALVNLGLFGDSDVRMTMAHYNVADWLFPLAFNTDIIIKYYACLAIVVLSAHKELTQIIHSSGTIELVFSFIKTHSPYHFAEVEPSHFQGRSWKWLKRLLPLLKSGNIEAVSLASFHFVMEARIKQRQGKTQIFTDIGAIEVLRKSASSIHKIPAQFSRQALKIIGITPPFSLYHPVPIWTVNDVTNWLSHIGFNDLSVKFEDSNIDGDILLTMTASIMENDLDINNGIVRLRLLREINKLKMSTTYETCDPTGVYDWLKTNVGTEYCKYTYALLKAGVDRKFLIDITDEMLKLDCYIDNSVHRTRILNAIEACKTRYQRDSQYSINDHTSVVTEKHPPAVDKRPSLDRPYTLTCENCVLSNHADEAMFPDDRITKNIDVFISYRRCNGSQLASLIMVHLKLRGYRVFLDIERLPAGKFNENLLQSIQRAKNFLIVLTPNSLDRCTHDDEKRDWIHMEIVCAMESNCNIIPITDRFEFPHEDSLPKDMKSIVHYNAVNWVHDYQDACIDKIEHFIKNCDCKCPFSPPQMTMSPILKQSPTSSNFIDDLLDC